MQIITRIYGRYEHICRIKFTKLLQLTNSKCVTEQINIHLQRLKLYQNEQMLFKQQNTIQIFNLFIPIKLYLFMQKPRSLLLPKIKRQIIPRFYNQTELKKEMSNEKGKCKTESVSSFIQQKQFQYLRQQNAAQQRLNGKKRQQQKHAKKKQYDYKLIALKGDMSRKSQRINVSNKQIQERKLLRQLISFFDSRDKELKNQQLMNKPYQIRVNNLNGVYQSSNNSSYRHSQTKAKLRISQNTSQEIKAPQIIKKVRQNSLKNSLKIQNILIQQVQKLNFFNSKPTTKKSVIRKMKQMQMIQKISSLGRWKTDHLQTNYLN